MAYDEGMFDGAEDAVLIADVIDLLRLNDILFIHNLHTHIFPCALLLHESNLTKRS